MNYPITALYVYPIKSLGGVALTTAEWTATGLPYDRFWMLVDENGVFITQRAIPEMALFEVQFSDNGISVRYEKDRITIPFELAHKNDDLIKTVIWKDEVLAQKESPIINDWFSAKLGRPVFLVRRADQEKRFIRAHSPSEINFPDDGQILVIGENSLALLNEKLPESVSMNRFRPNIVFADGMPHVEDEWTNLQIGRASFTSTKSCARCQMITIDQETARVAKEPLKTLATYRSKDNKIWFGRLIKIQQGIEESVAVGDFIRVG